MAKPKTTITREDILNIHRALRREDYIRPKPMVATDRKKKDNKNSCHKFKNLEED